MADIRAKDLTNTLDQIDTGDYFAVDDASTGETRKISKEGVIATIPDAVTGTRGLLSVADKAALDGAVAVQHSHSNKTTLDSYDQTNANLSDAVSKKHTANTDTQFNNGFTQVQGAALQSAKTGYDDAVTKAHAHSNATELNAITTGVKAKYDAIAANADSGGALAAAGIQSGAVTVEKIQRAVIGKNLFNPLDASSNKFLNDTDGIEGNATGYACTGFIPVTAGLVYVENTAAIYGTYFHFYDVNKAWLSRVATSGGHSFTVPASACYMRRNVCNVAGSIATVLSTYQFERNNVSTSFEKYSIRFGDSASLIAQGIDDLSVLSSKIASQAVTVDKTAFIKAGKNLFNKATVVSNKILADADGSVGTATGYACTDFIPISASTQYTDNAPTSLYGNYYHFFNSDKVWLSRISTGSGHTFTSPSGAAYFRRNLASSAGTITSIAEAYQLEAGASATGYEMYCYKVVSPDGLARGYADIMVDAIVAAAVPSIKNKIRILKTSAYIYVRSYFNDTYDVVVKFAIQSAASTNQNIGFYATLLIATAAADTEVVYNAGTEIHSTGDDITPVYTYNTLYFGGNHGLNVADVTVASHDKTSADVGSIWSDGTLQWILADVYSSTHLHFVQKNSGVEGTWTSTYVVNGSSLSHVSGATHTGSVSFSSQTIKIATPASLNRVKSYIVDGKYAITDNVVTYADYFDIVDQYDMVDPSTLVVAYPVNWANGSPWFRHTIVYRCQNYGAVVVDHSFEVFRKVNLGYMGGMQSAKITKGAYAKVLAYMPNALTNTGYNLALVGDITSIASTLDYTSTYWGEADNPPNRLVQFLADSGNTKYVGFAQGYNVSVGAGKKASRVANCYNVWQIYSSGKIYPRFADNKAGMQNAGTFFNVKLYRQYFDPQLHAGTTCVYFHKVGESDYVYIDVHSSVNNLKIKLPDYMVGKSTTVVEQHSNVSLVTTESVTSAGVIVTVTDYGFIVLKLS